MSTEALLPPHKNRQRWKSSGLNRRQEQGFPWVAAAIVLLLGVGWSWAILQTYTLGPGEIESAELASRGLSAEVPGQRPLLGRIGSALSSPGEITPSFLNDAITRYSNPIRGVSGSLYAAIGLPGERVAPGNPGLNFLIGGRPAADLTHPATPGIHPLAIEYRRSTRPLEKLNLVTLVPANEKQKGRIGTYRLGSWPWEDGGTPRSASYAPPRGFIQVTQENRDLHVSKHFTLGQFLTKDQSDVWPKYLLLDPKVLDKLELMIVELQEMGVDVRHMTVMSGFRTPAYNAGGGDTSGRANLSRHMYGDGVDVFLDNDEDFWTDDVNGDRKVDTRDVEMMAEAAERVERKHPSLVGGIGIYPTCCGHGPFVHVDVRGTRARWRGSGSG
ncbi:MAG: hypothetical protein ABR517_10170 [Thermoanaerobaculia bacterium]